MKSLVSVFFLCSLFMTNLTAQQNSSKSDTIAAIQDFKNLYRFGNFHLSGQPSYEMLLWLKAEGVKKIINLRSEKENSDFSAGSFNEEKMVKELGFEYFTVPVDGIQDYTPEKLNAMSDLLNRDEKILIHCAGAGRVSDFFMAYLIKNQGYTIDEAVEVGKKIKFALPLEKLLDEEIHMKIVE